MNNNEELNEAIIGGINAEAVSSTLEEIEEKADSMPKPPEQLKETVEVIVEMKSDKPDTLNPNYSSTLVQNNSNRIKEAMNSGIEPQEVAREIASSSLDVSTEKGRKHLNFVTKLIEKMKKKEKIKKIQKQSEMEKQKQKVYTNNN